MTLAVDFALGLLCVGFPTYYTVALPMVCEGESHMSTKITIATAAILFAFSGAAEARHHGYHHYRHHGYTHESAHSLNVMASARAQFDGLVADFQAMGYRIGTPGCLSSGHMAHSKHHFGGACDLFNQVARNRTALPQPPASVQIVVARRHGLIAGASWRHPDGGHFEVPGRHL